MGRLLPRGSVTELGIPHDTVQHSDDEWVVDDIHTDGVEGVWSLFVLR